MEVEKICTLGRSVIEIEAEMVAKLATRIDQKFAQACEYLHDCKGKIIVMGVGKSGHIGKKIAATFASTGSPSFFIHPSEAKHGDMGMVTKEDVLVLISNSGETEEVLAILPSIKRLGAIIISLAGRPNSTLSKAATINLDVSVDKEACPLGLAPTSSTTATLAMGDALAMALLDMRGFTKDDFALSHPGGALGRRLLLRTHEIMHTEKDIPYVKENALLKDALVEMTQKKLGMTTIINEKGELLGIFTDGDLRRILDKNVDIHQTPIHQVMSKNPKTINTNILAVEALHQMETYKITSLIVINEQKQPIGIIHIHDILRAGVV